MIFNNNNKNKNIYHLFIHFNKMLELINKHFNLFFIF